MQWGMALQVMKDWLLITENLNRYPTHLHRFIIDLRDRTSRIIAEDSSHYGSLPTEEEYLHQRPPRLIGGERPPEEES